MTTSWQVIGTLNPQDLTESRLQLHYAIQFIAATGAALAEPLPDYSHTSLEWLPDASVFAGVAIRSGQPWRVALHPVSLTLVLLDQHYEPITSLPLPGKTMAEGLVWLKQELTKLGADANKIVFLDYPPDDFPDHPIAHGAAFDASSESGLQELTSYYANTYPLVQTLIATQEDASAIHIWPHHFDMATLLMLPGTQNGTPMTIGVGLSPGDGSYPEPYWYVSPYPYPDTANLPLLGGSGFWHTQHWVGAVLLASQVTKALNAETQLQQVDTFLTSALAAAIALFKPDSLTYA